MGKEGQGVNVILDKELLKKAVYSKFVTEDVTAEMLLDGGVSLRKVEPLLEVDELGRRAAEKARELIFEGAWLALKANVMQYESAKELDALPTAPSQYLNDETAGKIALKLALDLSEHSYRRLIGAVMSWGRHMYMGQCDDCDGIDCPVWKEMHRIHITEAEL